MRKRTLYSDAGVREYWMVDPKNFLITIHHFEKDTSPTIFRFEDQVPVGIRDGKCAVDFSKILRKIRRLPQE